ncbi:hypothetical protein BY996DRAFT_6584121 [Phakopsora pachyrhizi]|nr:hypothetical protein BY996DRAFT_6584121 [Phakopsora pachyrhizi]
MGKRPHKEGTINARTGWDGRRNQWEGRRHQGNRDEKKRAVALSRQLQGRQKANIDASASQRRMEKAGGRPRVDSGEVSVRLVRRRRTDIRYIGKAVVERRSDRTVGGGTIARSSYHFSVGTKASPVIKDRREDKKKWTEWEFPALKKVEEDRWLLDKSINCTRYGEEVLKMLVKQKTKIFYFINMK